MYCIIVRGTCYQDQKSLALALTTQTNMHPNSRRYHIGLGACARARSLDFSGGDAPVGIGHSGR